MTCLEAGANKKLGGSTRAREILIKTVFSDGIVMFSIDTLIL